nr:hypothetical protein [Micromonospora sp. DSM 115978]
HLAAQADEPYVGTKWLGLKLQRLGRNDLLAEYDRFLAVPTNLAETDRYLSWAASSLAGLTVEANLPQDPSVHLSPAPGTEVWKVRQQHLVHRWGLAGIELEPEDPAEPVEEALTWSGPLSELTDVHRQLLLGGFVWLAVTDEEVGA